MTNDRDNHPREWYGFSSHVVQALVTIARPRGVTRRELADAMGVTYTVFSGYYGGKRGMPSVGALYAACELAGVEPSRVVAMGYASFQETRDDYALAANDPRPDETGSDDQDSATEEGDSA